MFHLFILFGCSFVHFSNSYGSEETFNAKISHQASYPVRLTVELTSYITRLLTVCLSERGHKVKAVRDIVLFEIIEPTHDHLPLW